MLFIRLLRAWCFLRWFNNRAQLFNLLGKKKALTLKVFTNLPRELSLYIEGSIFRCFLRWFNAQFFAKRKRRFYAPVLYVPGGKRRFYAPVLCVPSKNIKGIRPESGADGLNTND